MFRSHTLGARQPGSLPHLAVFNHRRFLQNMWCLDTNYSLYNNRLCHQPQQSRLYRKLLSMCVPRKARTASLGRLALACLFRSRIAPAAARPSTAKLPPRLPRPIGLGDCSFTSRRHRRQVQNGIQCRHILFRLCRGQVQRSTREFLHHLWGRQVQRSRLEFLHQL